MSINPPSSARLPATLVLLFVALVAGAVIWVTLAGSDVVNRYRAMAPRLDLELSEQQRTTRVRLEKKRRAAMERVRRRTERPRSAPVPVDTPPPPMPKLKPLRTVSPLAAAPDPELIDRSPLGPLPKIGKDGRKAWQVYARPFDDSDKRARLAIVIHGLGLNSQATESAILGLPGAVTLAFIPYADKLDEWLRRARAAGHDVLLGVPMEPANYPQSDPGPQALLTTLTTKQNLKRLEWTLGRATGYVGVTSYIGSRLTGSRRHLRPVLAALGARGLLYLDSRAVNLSSVAEIAGQTGTPWATSSVFIDRKKTRPAIDGRLEEVKRLARQSGQVIAMGNAWPVTLERVAKWIAQLKTDDFVLAPVSALVNTNTKDRKAVAGGNG